MAFNLQKVLKALLLSSNQALSIKDIQTVFTRFHDQAVLPLEPAETAAEGATESSPAGAPPEAAEAVAAPAPAVDEAAEVVVEGGEGSAPADDDVYGDVPSLVTATQIREAMQGIAEEFRARDDALLLIEGPTGFRLVTHPRFGRWIRILRDEPPPVKLTQSAIETLAIVAYRQPVTRTEIETVRGVSAEAGINKLLERELIYIVGRADLPGRPLQYGTTDRFLEFVGVKSLVELPSSDVLSPRQIDEWLKNAINPKPITDAEMGLPLEEGEGDSPNFEPVSVVSAPPPADSPADVPGRPDEPTSEPTATPLPA
ncbi:MAG: SMC-Scp complex subunit ScpB [Verrucomicrobia bacterium]|nr:SMC-Scp complex subunit ScpB [Verrucomicrobiota bacterium]